MIKILIVLFLFPLIVNSQKEFKISEKYINMYESGKSLNKITKKLKKENIGQIETLNVFNQIIKNAKKSGDDQAVIYFTFSKIDLIPYEILILEDTIGIYLRENYPQEYKKIENKANASFINYCSEYYPNINLELSFIYRYLHRLDQRYKQLILFYKNDQKSLDSLKDLSTSQDSITETILDNIFTKNGVLGIHEVGPQANVIGIFFLHLSPQFVFKYLPDLQEAIKNKRIFISDKEFEFIVDKSLHKCCNKTIYGTVWSKYSPRVHDLKEIESIKEKIGIQ